MKNKKPTIKLSKDMLMEDIVPLVRRTLLQHHETNKAKDFDAEATQILAGTRIKKTKDEMMKLVVKYVIVN